MTKAAPVLLLLKASIPEGSRWITVFPNGHENKGQPVLIQPNPDGSARVIGGAGGKLNYLKLRAVRSADDYKKEAATKKAAAAEARKVQRKKDQEAGILESKTKARQAVRDQQLQHERKFIETVGQAMGWAPEALAFKPPEGASDAQSNKLAGQHHRELMKRATEAVDMQRQRLAADAEARQAGGIGEVPVTSPDPAALTVQDIAPLPETQGGLGFSTDYGKRAAAAGADAGEVKKEAEAVRQATQSPEDRQKAVQRGETAKQVKKELQALREPIADDKLKADLVDAKKAVELLKAAKALREVAKKARDANKKIDAATTAPEPKAFVLEYTADPDADAKVRQELDDELRTARTTAFLSEFKRLGGEAPEETLGKHIGVGAYNSINSLALAVGGQALVDRSVVDVLGIAGAAQVLARRIHTDMPADAERVAEGMQEFHLQHYMDASEDALGRARELMDAAKEIELGEANNGTDLQTAQELNGRRRRAVVDAQKTLGQALGEMEANAALVVALRRGKGGDLQVSMGKLSLENAIERARAIGLQRGDYTVETSGGNTFLTVNGAGQDRLAAPIDRADVEQVHRNLAIISGRHDEDGWLPKGVANRPDLVMDVKPGVAPSLAQPFKPGADLQQSLRDYIGGRAADGDTPADIIADIQSADFFQKAGDAQAYRAALDAVAPLNVDGKQRRAEELGDTFDSYADQFTASAYGGERSPLNRQQIAVDQVSMDALHRALASHPDGVAAYKQIGELTSQDQRALRETFYRDIAKESPEAGALRRDLEAHQAAEPEKTVEDMFGETTDNPEHVEWRSRRDELAGKVNAASLDWNKYIETMGGHEKAYEAVQDLIKSRVGQAFAEAHNRLRPNAPVKLGRAVIRNNLNHLDATDHEARDARLARNRELVDSLRERSQGRYAAGSVSDKLDAARDEREAFEQAQMGFFSSEDAPAAATGEKPMAADERHTLGHAAERQISAMMGKVGQNFKPGQPLRIFAPTMSGGKNAARQRLVKMVDANKRVMAAFGTGSGKTLLQQASFTHLKEQGKAKRALYLVPSIVQGQFGGDALRFLEPGRYKWHCEPGASREARIAAHKDGSHDFTVMTHQSFRDDMLHLGAKHAGIPEREMADRLDAMTPADRKAWMRDVMEREGINYDFLSVDESQGTLNRAGKENSGLANVVDAMSANTPYYMAASGDPVKNDASEVFDLMSKMDPDRYRDRAAFMRRYGADTLASRDALKREMARYVYPSRIDPDVQAHRREEAVDLSEDQNKALAELDGHLSRARLARMQGKVDVDAMKAISPSSFDGVPADQHEALAKDLQANVGIMKQTAMQRIINEHPKGAKLDRLVATAAARKGKPGVVFAHSRKAVELARQRLEAEGHRVVVITGSDSAKEKEKKRLMFNPEGGEAQADILIASDAGATGMNIQRGQWLAQLDTPMTAMTHAQRQGRVYRTGQKNDVELIDFVANHPSERAARDRLAKKYGLRTLMTDSMEGLDDTGVAHFISQRRAAKNPDA